MRMMVCTLALLGTTAAHAADVAVPPRAYGMAPPPAAYAPPPVVAYGAPPAIITVPQGQAYIVQQPAYQAGTEYVQAPVLLDGTRAFRSCWHEFGQLRCAVSQPYWRW
jgi:hypothetical protein